MAAIGLPAVSASSLCRQTRELVLDRHYPDQVGLASKGHERAERRAATLTANARLGPNCFAAVLAFKTDQISVRNGRICPSTSLRRPSSP